MHTSENSVKLLLQWLTTNRYDLFSLKSSLPDTSIVIISMFKLEQACCKEENRINKCLIHLLYCAISINLKALISAIILHVFGDFAMFQLILVSSIKRNSHEC